ncbi:universal stress protein [Streptomyces sp. LMG1-1-1.1]|uniref:universal stress protein n=1 Tax=Streptomyces sp. LMG1-1-1.1 TaxID=3135245 RepID=UPI0034651856
MEASSGRPGPGPGRVVVGVDGSPSARSAVLWAAREAALRGSGLVLVHATDTDAATPFLRGTESDRKQRAGRELLDETVAAVAARRPELALRTELGHGPPSDALRRAAGHGGTIVVGHRGLGGFPSLLLGSVGLDVASTATTPVVVVRGAAEPAVSGFVLAAVRDAADLGCATAAAREAMLRKAQLRLLHIWREPPGARLMSRRGAEHDARDHVLPLSQVADHVREEFPELTVHADGEKSHSVAGAFVDASHHADLLVAGGRRSPGRLGPTLGWTTLSLLQYAHCPVELIPRHDPGHGSPS